MGNGPQNVAGTGERRSEEGKKNSRGGERGKGGGSVSVNRVYFFNGKGF